MEEQKEVVINKDSVQTPTLSNNNKTSNLPSSDFVPNSLSKINLFDDKQRLAAENFITQIMRSDKGGVTSVNDGLAMLMRAQDLNLPFSSCLEHIHVINGKTGVDVHIIKALLLRAGVTWECIDDYTPLYEYTDSINVYMDGEFPDCVIRCRTAKEAEEKSKEDDEHIYVYPVKFYKDYKNNIYRDYQLDGNKFSQVVNNAQAAAVAKSGKIPVFRIPAIPCNYVVRYKLTRTVSGKVMTSIGSFSYKEAEVAELFTKDTYKKYPRILIGHRAFILAARDIASDIIFGVMETTELNIVTNTNMTDEELQDIKEADIIA